MANFSLRGIDEETMERLKDPAKRLGVSVNTLMLEAVRDAAGTHPSNRRRAVHDDLDALAGTWTDEEARAFLASLSDFEQVDEELWRESDPRGH